MTFFGDKHDFLHWDTVSEYPSTSTSFFPVQENILSSVVLSHYFQQVSLDAKVLLFNSSVLIHHGREIEKTKQRLTVHPKKAGK